MSQKKKNYQKLANQIVTANDNLKKQLRKRALEKIRKLFVYKKIEKLFDIIDSRKRINAVPFLKNFFNRLRENKLKDAKYSYGNKMHSENRSKSKRLNYRKKIEHPQKKPEGKLSNIPYISLVPYLSDYLKDKLVNRKKLVFNLLKDINRKLAFKKALLKHINNKIKPVREEFFNLLRHNKIVQDTKGPMKAKLFSILRKKYIKTLFKDIEKPGRMAKILHLIKLTMLNRELAAERWLRALIRKWRFISFSIKISKKKILSMYKQFHINYLEMADNVFGDEERSSPSVIKEFERFGTNVGIWENPNVDNISENSKYYRRRQSFAYSIPQKYSIKTSKELAKSMTLQVEDGEKVYEKQVKKQEEEEEEKEVPAEGTHQGKGKEGETIRQPEYKIEEEEEKIQEIEKEVDPNELKILKDIVKPKEGDEVKKEEDEKKKEEAKKKEEILKSKFQKVDLKKRESVAEDKDKDKDKDKEIESTSKHSSYQRRKREGKK